MINYPLKSYPLEKLLIKEMKVRILGSGTSTGVPQIGCSCPVCTSPDPKDNRLRASAIVETEDARILIDCGPDFRAQVLHLPFEKIDGVLITHEHYDHVGGLDDLRPFCRFGAVPIYAEEYVAQALRLRMPYCFVDHRYPGVPEIPLQEVVAGQAFSIHRTEVVPLRVMHGRLPILGYRIGRLGYITDMLTMPEESYEQLEGIDVLIMNALRIAPHPTHQSLEEALKAAERIRAKETYFIHMSHDMGLHEKVEKGLPENVHLTYDGMEIIF